MDGLRPPSLEMTSANPSGWAPCGLTLAQSRPRPGEDHRATRPAKPPATIPTGRVLSLPEATARESDRNNIQGAPPERGSNYPLIPNGNLGLGGVRLTPCRRDVHGFVAGPVSLALRPSRSSGVVGNQLSCSLPITVRCVLAISWSVVPLRSVYSGRGPPHRSMRHWRSRDLAENARCVFPALEQVLPKVSRLTTAPVGPSPTGFTHEPAWASAFDAGAEGPSVDPGSRHRHPRGLIGAALAHAPSQSRARAPGRQVPTSPGAANRRR